MTIAVADCASPPIAKISPSAWFAAMQPNIHGSSINARKKSTLCTIAIPLGTLTTAASSGASRPINTSSRLIGWRLASARESTLLPTFAPQPPQRIAAADIACVCSFSSSGTKFCADASFGVTFMVGNSLNLRMKRRSIQSFHCHTQFPCAKIAPRDATACWSPVEIKASQRDCGRYAPSVCAVTLRRKFTANGGPIRTANTPAFSSGKLIIAAQSPAAKISGSVSD